MDKEIMRNTITALVNSSVKNISMMNGAAINNNKAMLTETNKLSLTKNHACQFVEQETGKCPG